MFAARKRGDQHDECTFRQVEVRDERIKALKFKARIDENIRPVIVLTNFAAFLCDRFNRAAARSADSDHASAVFLRLVDGVAVSFGM